MGQVLQIRALITNWGIKTFSRQSQSCASLKFRRYAFTETWKIATYIRKYWCYAKKNPSEETIPDSSQIKELHETMKLLNEVVTILQYKKHLKSLDNKLKQTSAWKTFNTRQKHDKNYVILLILYSCYM